MPGSLVTLVTWVTYCSFWMTAQEIEDACVTGNFGNLEKIEIIHVSFGGGGEIHC